MEADLKQANKILEEGGYTCVLVKGEACYASAHRGVKPLLQWLEDGTDLRGFSAADKVVGKAAAYLYVLLGVRAVYARVISRPSVAVLQEHGIGVTFECCVEAIRNRTNTGLCPMEQAVKDAKDPQQVPSLIRKALEALQSK